MICYETGNRLKSLQYDRGEEQGEEYIREAQAENTEKMLHKWGFKIRLKQYELHPLETQCHLRPDYCLHCCSAGPL